MFNSENYVAAAKRTDTPITEELIARHSNPETIRLIHAVLGMTTESAELADMLKRHLFYGKPIDVVNGKEELGDSLWYIALAVDVFKTTMNDILTMNVNKLQMRYPEKFNEIDAVERDLFSERSLLESHHGYADVSDREYCEMNNLRPVPSNYSKRGQDWLDFAFMVADHIENYTVPQYGDKGEDQASDWSVEMLLEQTKKYANRFGKNQREGQETLDFMKGAHYLQMAMTKLKEKDNETNQLKFPDNGCN
jgi:NTP pyrophosphatase (non-canonical NTP hydrolase)